ncbi:MAG: PspA/IM30 family protein [Sphaerochaetaceae bacterium]
MGVFSRFLDIVNANINSLLDRAEDPQKMLRMMIQEMEDTLIEIKSNCAEKMANRTRLERQRRDIEAAAMRWQSRAELAVTKGRDDLAREALVEKKRVLSQMERINEEIDNYTSLIKDSQNEINQLDEKLAEVKKKYQILREKAKQEEERSRTQETMRQDPMDHFASMEEKIDRMQAMNDLNVATSKSDTEKTFVDLENADDIDTQLKELKKHQGK